MKKYALILIVLILLGVGLSALFFTQDEKLDQTVFIETTESIRNLQALDKNLLLQLNQSRFNPQFDNEQLGELNYQISEEFDNLRYEALFEEIEQSPPLSEAVSEFEERFGDREQVLDTYIDGNTTISQGLLEAQQLTSQLEVDDAISRQSELSKSFVTNKSRLLALALGDELEKELVTVEAKEQLSEKTADDLAQYHNILEQINEKGPTTVDSFNRLSELETGKLLDTIEKNYVDYHNQAIGGSNTLRNGLIAYGSLLFATLLFFGFKIRQNYTNLEQEVADRTTEIKSTLEELQESQEQLIQSEKMASLGQMVAGVAHEINTPLGYVTSNLETLSVNFNDFSRVTDNINMLMSSIQSSSRDNREIKTNLTNTLKNFKNLEIPELMSESTQLLTDGNYGLNEISKLVSSLKDFARLDRQNSEQVDLHDCIESSVTIASNHIRENAVTVVRNYAELPRIACFPSKLNQLFLNIITNACQAMSKDGGELTISTQELADTVRIDFKDNGVGMDDEVKQKIFDPFFTTKEIGLGTGLGLSIAYKIITAHDGSIDVDSSLGKGTVISVTLPKQTN